MLVGTWLLEKVQQYPAEIPNKTFEVNKLCLLFCIRRYPFLKRYDIASDAKWYDTTKKTLPAKQYDFDAHSYDIQGKKIVCQCVSKETHMKNVKKRESRANLKSIHSFSCVVYLFISLHENLVVWMQKGIRGLKICTFCYTETLSSSSQSHYNHYSGFPVCNRSVYFVHPFQYLILGRTFYTYCKKCIAMLGQAGQQKKEEQVHL